ncbi:MULTISPECIES: ABC transporter substrate-binding protein [Microvirgula]|uniref:Iron-siderophore ABC transporter substrate-binding protein n=1 Tax=Microvirgula aerodenitrificans TaxID=57480 RepID=A0A2S0PEP7_9NEIS|nr:MULTISPECIES: iron-siderophore ABC transporter substrate-binding protein [Microvirgula]AVY95831.1 iron-siderophore ABC transporter substrate-binding protein [Microvirgula aerodenitrificans]RAS15761.1 iron complex transport system substrate-binding protein [Microvirgula sp. AG722]
MPSLNTGSDRISRRRLLFATALAALPSQARTPLQHRQPRVITLEYHATEMVLALGVTPVGVADTGGYSRWVGVEKARLATAINVGNRQQPSLEAIAMLRPDLIVAVDFRHASLKALLERIAPTLMLSSSEREGLAAVFEDHRQLALTLGLETRAGLALTVLDDCLARERNRLAAAGWAGKPLAILQHIAGVPQMWAFAGNSVPGGVQKALGLGGPWLHERARQGITVKTVEELLVLDVTLALLGGAPPQTPVWKQAPAVRHERLLVLPDGLWPFGGPVSTVRLVRALSTALLRRGHADRP